MGGERTGAGRGLQSGSLLRVGIEAVEPARGEGGGVMTNLWSRDKTGKNWDSDDWVSGAKSWY